MKKLFVSGAALCLTLGLTACGGSIAVEQNTTSIEVGSKDIIWKEFITLEEPEKYKITADASEVDLNELGDYAVTYSIEDKETKKAVEKRFTFTVEDTKAPELRLSEEIIEVVQNTDFDPLDYVKVKDNYDKLTKDDVIAESAVDTSKLGEYTVDYTVTDSSGNEAKKAASVTVVEEMTPARMEEKLAEQPVFITSTKYVVQDSRYKSLYPDMLQAILQNDSEDKIRDAVVAFAAWDKNGLPVKIKGNIDFSDGSYIKQVDFSDINLVPDATFGKNYGYSVDENNNINNFRAIVVSYTTFSDETWENPVYEEWCELFEGKEYIW